MSDARDAIAEAMALNKKLAASRLVRVQELQGELAALKAGGADAAQIASVASDLAVANGEYKEAMGEIASLRRLADQASYAGAAGLIASAANPDPFIRSAEEIALDNVRSHAAELEGTVKANEELKELEPDPVPPPPRKKSL